MRRKIYFITAALLLILFGNVSATGIKGKSIKADTMVVEYYPIPSPDEILSYIDQNNLNYRPVLLNKKENANQYNTSFEKRIGFGVYMADLAYALSFEQTGTALSYFELVERMGREMNIFPTEVEKIGQRFVDNINQHDSLKNLYTEAYIMMLDNLEQTENMGSYVIISAGSFIESIYLALNSLAANTEDDAFRLRIWQQKYIFNHLYTTADKYLDKNQKERLFKDLTGVKRVFDTYKERPKPVSIKEKDNGTIVLGQKSTDKTEKAAPIQELKKEIDLLRAKWVLR